MVDLVGYTNTQPPVSGWTNEKKTAMIDDFCSARGYVEQYDENNVLIQTKKEFMNKDITDYIRIMVNGKRRKDAEASVSFDSISF